MIYPLFPTEGPDLGSYDIILLNTSAGKDSSAMIDYVLYIAVTHRVVDRLVSVHCDLGRVEWDGVPELAGRQVARYGIPIHIVRREQGDLLDHVRQRRMWPSPKARYC